MTVSTFDPEAWLERAQALGRSVQASGAAVYFGRPRRGLEAEDAALFADLRAAGGVAVIRDHLTRVGVGATTPSLLD